MAQQQITVHPEAVAEAQAAYRWYQGRNETAAQAFVIELDRTVDLISKIP